MTAIRGQRSQQQRSADTLSERLWAKVDKSAGPTECWPWMGSRGPKGYGRIHREGRRFSTHRIVLELTTGRLLGPDELAAHRCDNPPCCNPTHLFAATWPENIADMVAKGRHRHGPTLIECRRGHPFTEANTAWYEGVRRCRTCKNARERARYRRARMAA